MRYLFTSLLCLVFVSSFAQLSALEHFWLETELWMYEQHLERGIRDSIDDTRKARLINPRYDRDDTLKYLTKDEHQWLLGMAYYYEDGDKGMVLAVRENEAQGYKKSFYELSHQEMLQIDTYLRASEASRVRWQSTNGIVRISDEVSLLQRQATEPPCANLILTRSGERSIVQVRNWYNLMGDFNWELQRARDRNKRFRTSQEKLGIYD